MADDLLIVDGFLDEETLPGDAHGSTARFRLTISPSDERSDEAILPCTVADPVLARTVLDDLQPGDQLRVTGWLRLPRSPGDVLEVCVDSIELLEPAPPQGSGGTDELPPLPSNCSLSHDSELERFGPYIVHYDPDTTITSVWRQDGKWVGADAYPVSVDDLIDAFERDSAAGEI